MIVDKLKEMVRTLNRLRDAYYNKNISLVSDTEYDRMFDELVQMEEESGVVLSNSPTHTVGYRPVGELATVRHPIPLLSLDKTKVISKLVTFIGRNRALLMIKMDGLTVKLTYERGKLKEAATRGDGDYGEMITHNIPTFRNVPLSIPYKERLVVAGEAFIHKDDFMYLRENTRDSNGEKYKSARNLASGSVRCKDPENCEGRRVHFIPFQVLEGMEEEDSRTEKLGQLEKMGFDRCPYVEIDESSNDPDYLELCIADLAEKAETMEIPIDGIVAVYDSYGYAKSCGKTERYYKDGIAYKFEDRLYDTVLTDIEWTPTRFGEIAPVGVFDPVEVDGSSISRATLHHLTHIKNMGLVPGCRIRVARQNMIIPKIIENLDSELYTDIVPPRCPCCNAETRVERRTGSNGTFIETVHCDNPACETQNIRKFEHFASKKALNIDGLSNATLKRLFALGCLNSFQDIYHLDRYRGKIIRMDGFGEKSFERLWSAIQSSRHTSFVRYLVGMDIPMIGSTKSKVLNEVFHGDLDAFEKAAIGTYDFTQLEDFGEILNQNIHAWFANEDNLEVWRSLQMEMDFVAYTEKQQEADPDNYFFGKTIVATGTLKNFTRDGIHAQILACGGKPGKSVSRKTDFLIAGEKAGSKLEKAKELGVPILTEQEFLDKIA